MNLCAFFICVSLSGSPSGDMGGPWVSEDKWMHFFASFAATSMAVSGARALGADADTSLWIGAGVGGGAGIAKEIRDLYVPEGHASWRDLVWNLSGVGAGVAVMRQTH